MTLGTTRAELVRSVLEGVAYNSRWLLETVEKFVGRPFPWLHFIGGGAQSELWCQIMADVLDREIRQVEHPIRANARGAALLAGIALGRDRCRRPRPQRTHRRDVHARPREPRGLRRALRRVPRVAQANEPEDEAPWPPFLNAAYPNAFATIRFRCAGGGWPSRASSTGS